MADAPDFYSSQFTVRCEDDILIVQPHSDNFVEKESRELEDLFLQARRRGLKRLVLDLLECRYISSEGLGCIANSWKESTMPGGIRMAVILPHDTGNDVHNLFEIIGLARTIGSALRPSIDDAITYLREFS